MSSSASSTMIDDILRDGSWKPFEEKRGTVT